MPFVFFGARSRERWQLALLTDVYNDGSVEVCVLSLVSEVWSCVKVEVAVLGSRP